ncbi:MAG TPA: Hsp20/alpha crystallin family protein [Anditalea sp.]|nr:Hsp20/alpha crystallin family protein [Anditalea sp.]
MKLVNYNVLEPKHSRYTSGYLNGLFQENGHESFRRFTPAVDIYEEEQHYGIILALPGVKKDNIQINLIENKLQISGVKEVEVNHSRKYHINEICQGSFSKTFQLPKDVNQDKIEAKYEEGLLRLLLPKNQKLTQKYQIEIK